MFINKSNKRANTNKSIINIIYSKNIYNNHK